MRGVRRWLARNLGGLPGAFWQLWAGTLVNRIGGFIVIYLSVYLVAVREFSPSFAGLVVGLYGGGGALGSMVGGVLADRWGRRPTVVTANLATAGVAVALGLVTSGPAIAALTALLGALHQAARPALSAMIAEVVPESDRLRAFNLNYWAINLGFAAAALLAGVLAGLDYHLLFFLDAATTVLAALVVARVPDTRRAPRSPQEGQQAGGIGEVLRDRVFLGLVVGTLLTWMIVETLAMLPVAMRSDGLPVSSYGSVVAVNGILIVTGQLFVPRLVGRSDRSRSLALASVIIGIGFGLVALADQVWTYAATVAIWTVGEMLTSPATASLVSDLSPARLRGRYNGVASLGYSVASFSAPLLAGATVQHLGETALWTGCLVLGLVVAGIHLLAGPAREHRIAQVREEEARAAGATPVRLAPAPASGG